MDNRDHKSIGLISLISLISEAIGALIIGLFIFMLPIVPRSALRL